MPIPPLLHGTISHTWKSGTRQPPSRHHTPLNLLSGQATWLRCRVLDEPLAIPWCQNLASNTVVWRSRPCLRFSLWMGVECLSSARLLCGSVRNLNAIILHMFYHFCTTLHCRSSEVAIELRLSRILGIDIGISTSTAGKLDSLVRRAYPGRGCYSHDCTLAVSTVLGHALLCFVRRDYELPEPKSIIKF